MRILLCMLLVLAGCARDYKSFLIGTWQKIGEECTAAGENCSNIKEDLWTNEYTADGVLKVHVKYQDWVGFTGNQKLEEFESTDVHRYVLEGNEIIITNKSGRVHVNKFISLTEKHMVLNNRYENVDHYDRFIKVNK